MYTHDCSYIWNIILIIVSNHHVGIWIKTRSIIPGFSSYGTTYAAPPPPTHTHKQKLKRHKDSNFSNAQGYYSHVTYGKSQLFIAHFSYTSMDYFEAKRSAAFYFEIHQNDKYTRIPLLIFPKAAWHNIRLIKYTDKS